MTGKLLLRGMLAGLVAALLSFGFFKVPHRGSVNPPPSGGREEVLLRWSRLLGQIGKSTSKISSLKEPDDDFRVLQPAPRAGPIRL